jgi:hypothetical protein
LESLTGVAPIDDDGNAAAKAAPRQAPRVDVGPLDAGGMSNKDIKADHARMIRMLDNCTTLDDLTGWQDVVSDGLEAAPEDVREDLRGRYKRKRDELKALV